MTTVNFADILSVLGMLVAVVCVGLAWRRIFRPDTRIMLLGYLLVSLIMYISNFLEWSGITGTLEPFEDYLEVLVPVLLMAFGYTFIQHAAEERLRRSEARYRTLIESATDGILLLRGSRFAECNASMLRIYGCSREAIIGRTPWDFSPERQPDGSLSSESASRYIVAPPPAKHCFSIGSTAASTARRSMPRSVSTDSAPRSQTPRSPSCGTSRPASRPRPRRFGERRALAVRARREWRCRGGTGTRAPAGCSTRRWEEMLGLPDDANSQSPDDWQRRVHPTTSFAPSGSWISRCPGKSPSMSPNTACSTPTAGTAGS